METPTIESPASTPSAVGGSKTESTPTSAPSGTSVTHGTAGSALIAAAERAMKEEGAASSAATAPAAKPAGDTTGTVTKPGDTTTASTQEPPAGQASSGTTEPARNPELEQRFQNVARNAQTKVLEALGLKGITYQQIPAVAKEIQIAFGILRDLRKNPRDFATRLAAELDQQDGTAATGAPGEFKLPEGRLTTEDGKTRVYSEDQIRAEVIPALKKLITQELLSNGALSKVINYVDEETSRRQSEQQETERRQTVASALTEAREWPHFKEHEQKIVSIIAALNAADPARIKARGVAWALSYAYNQVLQKDIYGEGYRNTIENQVREDMKRKANGQTGATADGTGRVDGTKPKLDNVTDLAEHLRRLEAAG